MTRIIHLHPTPAKIDDVTIPSAWHFICAALWPGVSFSRAERKRSYRQLTVLLTQMDKVTLYERILLQRSHLQTEVSPYLPPPSLWLNVSYDDGINKTASFHNDFLNRKPNIPNFHEQIRALAYGYAQYCLHPCRFEFNCCDAKLRSLKAFSLMQIFYDAVTHLLH